MDTTSYPLIVNLLSCIMSDALCYSWFLYESITIVFWFIYELVTIVIVMYMSYLLSMYVMYGKLVSLCTYDVYALFH